MASKRSGIVAFKRNGIVASKRNVIVAFKFNGLVAFKRTFIVAFVYSGIRCGFLLLLFVGVICHDFFCPMSWWMHVHLV